MCIDSTSLRFHTSYIVPGIINILGDAKFFCTVDSHYRHYIYLKNKAFEILVKIKRIHPMSFKSFVNISEQISK